MNRLSNFRRFGPPTVLAVVTLVFIYLALGFDPTSGQVPILVGAVMLVLLALDIVTRTRTGLGDTLRRTLNPDCMEATGIVEDDVPFSKELVAILWICGFTALIMLVGFVLAIPIYLATYMLIQGRFSLAKTAAITLCFSASVWLLFELGLAYRLYGGILFN